MKSTHTCNDCVLYMLCTLNILIALKQEKENCTTSKFFLVCFCRYYYVLLKGMHNVWHKNFMYNIIMTCIMTCMTCISIKCIILCFLYQASLMLKVGSPRQWGFKKCVSIRFLFNFCRRQTSLLQQITDYSILLLSCRDGVSPPVPPLDGFSLVRYKQ